MELYGIIKDIVYIGGDYMNFFTSEKLTSSITMITDLTKVHMIFGDGCNNCTFLFDEEASTVADYKSISCKKIQGRRQK